eukprot:2724248-Pyramimonas_sp.AAC.1
MAVALSSEDASASLPESKSDSADCPAEPIWVMACIREAASGGRLDLAQGSCDPEAVPPF